MCVCTSSPGRSSGWQAITLHFFVEIHTSAFKFCRSSSLIEGKMWFPSFFVNKATRIQPRRSRNRRCSTATPTTRRHFNIITTRHGEITTACHADNPLRRRRCQLSTPSLIRFLLCLMSWRWRRWGRLIAVFSPSDR